LSHEATLTSRGNSTVIQPTSKPQIYIQITLIHLSHFNTMCKQIPSHKCSCWFDRSCTETT